MKNSMAYVHNQKITQNKYSLYFRLFWVKEPRHSESISARKRYTLIQFTTVLGQGAPSFRKHFCQKEVYLDTIHDGFGLRTPRHSETVFARKRYTLYNLRRFWVKEPRHSENVFARKRYSLIQFPTDFGVRRSVIHRTFQTKTATSTVKKKKTRSKSKTNLSSHPKMCSNDSISPDTHTIRSVLFSRILGVSVLR